MTVTGTSPGCRQGHSQISQGLSAWINQDSRKWPSIYRMHFEFWSLFSPTNSLFSTVKLRGFHCTVTNHSSSSTAVLRSILRPTGFAHTVIAALPCQRAEGDRFPPWPNTCVFLSSVRMPGFIPQLWLVMVPTSLHSSGICLFVYSSSFNKRWEQEASQSWCKESKSLL